MKLKPVAQDAFLALLRNDFLIFMEKGFQTFHPGVKFLRNWHHEAVA